MQKFLLLAIVAILVLAIFISIITIGFAKKYYRELNEARLHPLGPALPAIPIDSTRLTLLMLGDSRALSWNPGKHIQDIQVVNAGVNGFTSEQLRYRIQAESLPVKGAVVIIQIGINDLKTLPLFPHQKEEIIAALKKNIKESLAACQSMGARKIILTTIFPVGRIPFIRKPFWSDEINQAVLSVNKFILGLSSEGVTVFDAYALLEDTGRKNGWGREDCFSDALHLNARGYELLDLELLRLIHSALTDYSNTEK